MKRATKRVLAWALVAGLTMSACAGPKDGLRSRGVAKGVLIALAVLGTGATVGSAIQAEKKEKTLRDDLNGGQVTGRQFASEDAEGVRSNRIGRASAFVAGLSLLGLAIVWEMGLSDRVESGKAAPYVPLGSPPVTWAPPLPLLKPPRAVVVQSWADNK